MVICEYYDGKVNQLPTGGNIFKVYLLEQGGWVKSTAVGGWGGGGGGIGPKTKLLVCSILGFYHF
jgi:hypothetical protein